MAQARTHTETTSNRQQANDLAANATMSLTGNPMTIGKHAGHVAPGEELDPRIYQSIERTVLAWVRTGLALMGLGFVVARVSLLMDDLARGNPELPVKEMNVSLWVGIVFVALGVAIMLWAGGKYKADVRRIRSGTHADEETWSMVQVVPIALGIIGLFVAVYLIELAL